MSNKKLDQLIANAIKSGIQVGTRGFWKLVSGTETVAVKSSDFDEVVENDEYHTVTYGDYRFNITGKPKPIYTAALFESLRDSKEYGIEKGEKRVRIY